MNVCYNVTVHTSKSTNLHVLTKCKEYLLNSFLNCIVAVSNLCCKKSVNICGVSCNNCLCNSICKVYERLALCNEVRLTVNFNKSTWFAVVVRSDNALSSNSACLFSSRSKSLFSQNFNSLIDITIGFNKSLFTIHHTYACLLTKSNNVFCCKCHNIYLRFYLMPAQILCTGT